MLLVGAANSTTEAVGAPTLFTKVVTARRRNPCCRDHKLNTKFLTLSKGRRLCWAGVPNTEDATACLAEDEDVESVVDGDDRGLVNDFPTDDLTGGLYAERDVSVVAPTYRLLDTKADGGD